MVTRTAQKKAATNASADRPKTRNDRAIRSPATSSTVGYTQPIEVPQVRQRPRSSSQESTGTLSRQESSVPQLMHAEAGATIERLSGTRAATTFRKLPIASPGTNATAAAANDISGSCRARLRP